MSFRSQSAVNTLLLALALASSTGSLSLAQVSPSLPAPGTSGVFQGTTNATQQQVFNFVAFPVGEVQTPTGTQQLEYRFSLPIVFNQPYVPTDQSGVGGSLGHAQGLRERILGPDRNTLPDSTGVIVARDPRYTFSGRWSPIIPSPTQVATLPNVLEFPAVIVPRTSGSIEKSIVSAQIMPTTGTSYTVSAPDEVSFTEGALLIKGGDAPLHVLMPIGNDNAVVRIEHGTFAMVSNFGGRVTVTNLSDTHNSGCVVLLTDKNRRTYGEMPVRIGYMVEVYPNTIQTGENRLVAYTVLNQLRLSNGFSVETTRINYPRAFKRFNISRNISTTDLQRIVKSAAAVSYMDRQREVNGFTPSAQ